ncbi:MSM1 Methionine--tRNA ligase [Candida maltosa Xu316]
MKAHKLKPLLQLRYASTKPFYLTTPIFYVNAAPHIGHAYSMLLADTKSRWEKLNPNKTSYMLTGTDEHGLKIQATAEKQGIEPKDLVDRVSQNFAQLAKSLNVDYDRFMRTTDADHIEVVRYFWDLMMSKGFIYTDTHSGWYSVSDETFYPETQIEKIEKDGKEITISTETRNELVYQEETNYFFKLSLFQDQLIEYLQKNPDFIKPEHRYQFILKELQSTKLSDLSISRPSSRLKWSIEVPNDPDQKIYVWFDALLNYISAAGFPKTFVKESSSFVTPENNIWPATHIIGKDIIRFHCIYWPIFLMAGGIELPKQVIVHSHWLCDGVKMSKSLGNVVDPLEISEYYGVDPVRFFLTENSNIDDDCKFSEELLQRSRDGVLGKYCNLISRIGSKNFDVRASVEDFKSGGFKNVEELIKTTALNQETADEMISSTTTLINGLDKLYEQMDDHFTKFDYIRAIQCWWSVVNQANQLFQSSEPWTYAKLIKDEATPQELKQNYKLLMNYVTFLCAETVRISSILIQPVMPELADKILTRLNVTNRDSDYAKFGIDLDYGTGANDASHKVPLEKIKPRT